MLFIVINDFKFQGIIRKSGSVIDVQKKDVEIEIAKGKKQITQEDGTIKVGNWLSGLLNHCAPDDEEAELLISGEVKEKTVDKTVSRIQEIYAEMDELGAAYDRRWRIERLENELVKAKKLNGV
jgi:hypothetical protein